MAEAPSSPLVSNTGQRRLPPSDPNEYNRMPKLDCGDSTLLVTSKHYFHIYSGEDPGESSPHPLGWEAVRVLTEPGAGDVVPGHGQHVLPRSGHVRLVPTYPNIDLGRHDDTLGMKPRHASAGGFIDVDGEGEGRGEEESSAGYSTF
ncbi:hypothetical protein NDU88_000871 [Pleurodeles waltl]|uniref:Uncharacterized protein n=1 Tax=Pleurodeles waltl TaxID=8319 RepID=A0AAV7WKZ5_PLEWA|nr:hypothetical protein NDU88_000871 [Pleurodeles waltl]